MSLPLTRSQWDGTYTTGSMGSRVTPLGENLRDTVAFFLVVERAARATRDAGSPGVDSRNA